MTSEQNVLTKILSDDMTPPLCRFPVGDLDQVRTRSKSVYSVNKSFKKECSLPLARLHSHPSRTRLWPNSEDAPDPSVKLEGLLSPVEIVAWYTTRPTGAIHWNHFVMR